MTADFDISFFAYMRITFLRNCSCSDNLLKDMNNNTANAVNYRSCAENRCVKSFMKNYYAHTHLNWSPTMCR